MQLLYNFITRTTEKLLPVTARFSSGKVEKFIDGRKNLFQELEERNYQGQETIWFHAASLGEYEQAVPVMQGMRQIFPEARFLLTFFSPSGYEIRKRSSLADEVFYLPLDTPENAKKFLDLVQPKIALFIKYEFWPNFLQELQKRQIQTLLISGVFRKNQPFFQPWGKWMRRSLEAFDHFFVQDEASAELIKKHGFSNVSISGDTRFDRVFRQLSDDNEVGFASEFKNGKFCLVAGSTWPEDENLLLNAINSSSEEEKFIIAPHELKSEHIDALQSKIEVPQLLYSEMEGKNLADFRVLILNTIGLLSKVYSYADLGFVGGAAGNTGLHNVLEPATFGIPVITGKNISGFPEAVEMKRRGGLITAQTQEEFLQLYQQLRRDDNFRKKTGEINRSFVKNSKGATEIILQYLEKKSETNRGRD